jgi:hypothetical protein
VLTIERQILQRLKSARQEFDSSPDMTGDIVSEVKPSIYTKDLFNGVAALKSSRTTQPLALPTASVFESKSNRLMSAIQPVASVLKEGVESFFGPERAPLTKMTGNDSGMPRAGSVLSNLW